MMNLQGEKDFIPECYVDTNLTETLLELYGHPTKGVNHQHGCNNVCRTMSNYFTDEFAVGIIDGDKKSPSYVSCCEKIAQSCHIELLKHRNRHHYLLIVSPAIEGFIIDCAKEMNVDLRQYGLNPELNELRKLTKKVTANQDARFKNLFKAIKDAQEIQILGRVLTYLKEQKYSSDVETLKTLFCQ